jgi:single-strand DNA-binding protein
MNRAIIIGRLTKDPEMRTTGSGIATTSFTVAVSRNYTSQNGERETDFLNCVAWRKQAENIAKFCSKGSQVAVEGRIQTRSYDAQDGTKRYVTEIIADNVTFLGSKGGAGNSNPSNSYNENNSSNSNKDIQTTDLNEDPYANMGEEVALSDDDLPF